jgi:hypothetical protein
MISVALATYNGLAFLPQQVDSILSQLAADDELVVSDDVSTDGTFAWLSARAAGEPRLRLFQNPGPAGVVANFNQALTQCRGEIIFLADQDDLWLPGKVATIRQVFAENRAVLLVQSDACLIDAEGNLLAPSFYALRRSGPGFWRNFWRNTYQGCSLAARRDLLALALPLPSSLPMHDMWLGLLAELAGQVRFIPDKLTCWRRHTENSSSLAPSSPGQVLIWRVALGAALLGRLCSRRTVLRKLRRQSHAS